MDGVRLDTLPSRALAVIRHRASSAELPRIVPESCGSVWSFLRDHQIKGAGRHVALYWDGEINLEVGVELDTPFPSDGRVVASATPPGLVASATHLGPYQQLYKVHTAIRQWCDSHGYELAGPSWEIYGHWEAAWNRDPSKIRTEVFYLVRSKKGDT